MSMQVVETVVGRVEFSSNMTKSENRLAVVNGASTGAALALVGVSGAIGKAARHTATAAGVEKIARDAGHGNYRGVAEYLAVVLGKPIVISNRGSFEALPDMVEGFVLAAKAGKNGGMRESKGVLVPGAALKAALEAHAAACWIVARAREAAEERAAKRAAASAALANVASA